jgi:hypothetical protein
MTTLQEIKAMLDRYEREAFIKSGGDLEAILKCFRAALPVIEAAKQQEATYAEEYFSACCRTDDAIHTFTESYPDERA